jgi:hypothetical protein
MAAAPLLSLTVWLALFAFGPWTALAALIACPAALVIGGEWARFVDEAEHG